MSQNSLTNDEIREIISRISFKEHEFAFLTPPTGELFLQLRYMDADGTPAFR